ncbi:MAG: DUF481 domain-containing protein [Proteobacteria bacterium]|nr:DUF481 domain-containing protein [Pseudomonadota bacterium]
MYSTLARIFVLFLLLTISLAVQADKTDVVYLQNGDRITGEVESLFRSKLEFKTDHMGTVHIEWEDIREIISTTGQAVELTSGQRLYGPLTKPENIDILVVKTDTGPVGVKTDDVYRMYPVEAGFWDRLDLTARLGFSWDKGSNVGKYNIGADAVYRRAESLSRADFSTEITTVDARGNKGEEDFSSSTRRTILGGNHLVYKQDKRFLVYFGTLEQNDELGVDLRVLAGAGYGYIPIRSQSNWLSLAAGLNINREYPGEGDPETNLEATGMLTYEYYKYDTPERSFKVNLMLFPSITDFGRFRTTFNTDFRIEIVEDFFWKLDIYLTYDSDPLSLDGASSDYGFTSSVAYKF